MQPWRYNAHLVREEFQWSGEERRLFGAVSLDAAAAGRCQSMLGECSIGYVSFPRGVFIHRELPADAEEVQDPSVAVTQTRGHRFESGLDYSGHICLIESRHDFMREREYSDFTIE